MTTFIVLLIIVSAVIGRILMTVKKKTGTPQTATGVPTPDSPSLKDRVDKWVGSQWPPSAATWWTIVGLLALYLIPYFYNWVYLYWDNVPMRNAPNGVTVSDWWWNKTVPWQSPLGFFLILCLILFGAMMKKDPNKPFHHKLAPIGALIVAPLFIWHLSGYWTPTTNWEAGTAIVNQVKSLFGEKENEVLDSVSATGADPVRMRAYKFWYEHVPEADRALLMIHITELESNFRQFNPDGTVLTHVNEDGTVDVGITQLNTTYQKDIIEKFPNFDINTEEGNLLLALEVYKEKGPEEWTGTFEEAMNMGGDTITIIAPVGRFSETFRKDPQKDCHGTTDGPVIVKGDYGEYPMFPNNVPSFATTTVAYKTPEGYPPSTVKYTCR